MPTAKVAPQPLEVVPDNNALERANIDFVHHGQQRRNATRPLLRHRIQCALCNIKGGRTKCIRCGVVENTRFQLEALPEGGGSLFQNLRGVATATWIRSDILAMSRPATRSFTEYNFGQQLKDAGVTAIFNTEEPYEHPYCGEALAGAFTYEPALFHALGMSVHLCGWADLGVPSLLLLRDAVLACCAVLERGERIAVHCHAGFGRTGVLIACVLVYREELAADEAIAVVRSRRHKCIQNSKQQKCVRNFAAQLSSLMEGKPSPMATNKETAGASNGEVSQESSGAISQGNEHAVLRS